MLQQTQVEAVRPYFQRFMERFPTVVSLAAASEDDILQYWAGLGYYGRARNLHRAAQLMVELHAGEVPSSMRDLLALPGIGRYTGGAIASIAFGLSVPILDGNVMRVLCRIMEIPGDPRRSPANGILWDAAAALADGSDPGTVNEALMELGATICVPIKPRCESCPLRRWCCAAADHAEDRFPQRDPAPVPEDRNHVALVVRQSSNVLIQQPVEERLWRGLWRFPTDFPEWPHRENTVEAAHRLAERVGVRGLPLEKAAVVRHGVMNWKITLTVFETCMDEGEAMNGIHPAVRWIAIDALPGIALPSPHRRIAAWVLSSGG
jgi:A/G-specific adenine glycosylase